jgi:D-alanine-D-alanine ligase
MDKSLAKQVAAANSIPVAKFLTFTRDQLERDPTSVISAVKKSLKYPVFIKPTHLGSSIGISRAADDDTLQNGLEVAVHYDDKVLVEEAIPNLIEVTLPIIGNDQLTPALLEEPLTKAEDFFDFDTKYLRGTKSGKAGKGSKGAQGYSQIPADLPKSLYESAEATALQVYHALGCSGIARIDMLINSKTKIVYFNEVNPLPGGLYAHNWHKAGISSVELVQRLITLAKERQAQRDNLTTIFTTNYLQQF